MKHSFILQQGNLLRRQRKILLPRVMVLYNFSVLYDTRHVSSYKLLKVSK